MVCIVTGFLLLSFRSGYQPYVVLEFQGKPSIIPGLYVFASIFEMQLQGWQQASVLVKEMDGRTLAMIFP